MTSDDPQTGSTLRRRDPDVVRARLEGWLAKAAGLGEPVEVTALTLPSGAGFSNETYLFDTRGSDGEGSFVLQAAPIGEALFQSYDLRKVFELQRALAGHGLPVAPMRWYEAGSEVLGAPFYVMDRVAGEVPADRPTYHAEGFVTTMPPAQREEMWWAGLSAMARLHAIDPASVGVELGPLEDPIAYRLDHWTQFVRWASPDPLPHFDDIMAWLRANRPHPKAAPSIIWGDAKLSNVIFDGTQVRALLDWELCGVGPAEDDLSHWMWLDHFAARSAGIPRLEGLPGRDATLAFYARALGREIESFDWWWVYAIMRLQAVVHRIMQRMRALGNMPANTDIGAANSVTGIIRELLDELG